MNPSSFLGPRFVLDLQAFFRDFSDKRGYTLHLGVTTPGCRSPKFHRIPSSKAEVLRLPVIMHFLMDFYDLYFF